VVRNNSLPKGESRPQVGSFSYIVRDDHWEWSDEVARIHGYEPGSVTPTTDLVLAHKHPDDQATVGDLIVEVYRQAAPVTSRHRIVDARGKEHLVTVVGDLFYKDGPAPAGVAGFYIDITQQFNRDVQTPVTEAVQAITARRAVIDQAIGMLMQRYGVDPDSAFQLLTKLSQESNTKLRLIAERIINAPNTFGALVDKVARLVDTRPRSCPARQHLAHSRPDHGR
jgi:hypothetical protein